MAHNGHLWIGHMTIGIFWLQVPDWTFRGRLLSSPDWWLSGDRDSQQREEATDP